MAAEGAVIRADELGRERHGWLVRIPAAGFIGHRDITFIGHRRWTRLGEVRCGLLGLNDDGPFRATEYHVAADADVTPIRPLRRAPKPRKGDYPTTTGEDR